MKYIKLMSLKYVESFNSTLSADKKNLHYVKCNEEAIRQLAGMIAKHCNISDCLALHGELGAGKTTFARYFIQSLYGEEVAVASPTFTLCQLYQRDKLTLWHYDLYRLENVAEVEEAGLTEALTQGITLIEWSDIAQIYLPAHTLHITFAFHEKPDYRDVTLQGDELWMQRLPKTI